MGFCKNNLDKHGFDKRIHLKRITDEYHKEHGNVGFITNISETKKYLIIPITKENTDIFIGKSWDVNGDIINGYIGVYYDGDLKLSDNVLRKFWNKYNPESDH